MQSQPQQLVFSRALAHLRGGDANRAASVCLEGLEQYPNDANILCLAGKSLLVLKRFPEARIQIEKASTLYPKFPVAHETLADLLLAEGQFEEAVKSYQLALQLDPARSDLHAKIARANELIKSMIAAGGSRRTMCGMRPRPRKRGKGCGGVNS